MKFHVGNYVIDPVGEPGVVTNTYYNARDEPVLEIAYEGGVYSSWSPDNVKFAPTDAVPKTDNVNSPSHYQFPGGVEVIQITEHLNFCKGNAVKYLTRSGRKAIADEVEDLKKAKWYIEREIARIEASQA